MLWTGPKVAGLKSPRAHQGPEGRAPISRQHFETLIYAGNGADNRAITGLKFKPDFVWIKRRTSAQAHALHDVLRGPTSHLETHNTEAEENVNVYGALSSFDQGGYTISRGSGGGADYVNTNGHNYVAWCWKAGGAAVSNTDGDITSSVSVNEEAGFSIATYTGSTASGALTVGHGLGRKPAWVIIKRRDSTGDWIIGHQGLATNAFQNNKFLKFASNAMFTNSLVWGAEPTTTVTQIVTNGAGGAANLTSSGTYVMYSWAEIPGYSKFGSYEGNNNSDGTYVPLGFRPAWVMIKNIEASSTEWYILDAARDVDNPAGQFLSASSNAAEATYIFYDFLSDGFKLRNTGSAQNPSQQTIIYMAFAEQPLTTPFDTFPNAR